MYEEGGDWYFDGSALDPGVFNMAYNFKPREPCCNQQAACHNGQKLHTGMKPLTY